MITALPKIYLNFRTQSARVQFAMRARRLRHVQAGTVGRPGSQETGSQETPASSGDEPMRGSSKLAVTAMAAAAAVTIAACSSSSSSSPTSSSTSSSANGGSTAGASAKVTLSWWHNGNTQPLMGTWQQVATAYHDTHPNVSFSIDPFQNEQFKTKIPLALKSNNPPDIFQQWGSGQEADQIQSGKLADISSLVSSWIGGLGKAADAWQVNGKQYGVPYDLHVVGFWYRTDLFAKAGISAPPTTIAELGSDDA